MPKTILIVSAPAAYGGGEVYVEQLVQELRQNYRFVVMTSLGSWRRSLAQQRIHSWPLLGAVRFYSIWGVRLYRLLLPWQQLQLLLAVWRWRPDVIWVQSNEERLAVADVARWCQVPVLWTMHGPIDASGSRWYQKRFRQAASKASRIICVSKHVRDAVVAAGARPDQCQLIPNGVAVPRAALPDVPTGTVAFIGRLEIEKGPDMFVAAALRVLRLRPQTQFVIAGDGSLMAALKHQAASAGEAIRFLGWTPSAAVLADCQLVVAPSRVEAQGLAVLEAMASGRPVVAAHVGGLAEIITSGKTGQLVPPDDPVALADAIAELLDDPAQRRRLGHQGRVHVEQHYQQADWVSATHQVLEHVL
ncbi:glycosyltransferase family 4 protein [bacterium]|nr:MAG: glycosyltransferase family 4 protein [bacterium]